MQDYYMHNKNEKGSIGYDFRLNEKILKGRYEATLYRYWDTNILYLHHYVIITMKIGNF